MKHAHYRRSTSPVTIFAFSILLFWLFGFKLFFFFPLMFIFGGFCRRGQCGMSHDGHNWTSEKPKRKTKPKYDDDMDDITYV